MRLLISLIIAFASYAASADTVTIVADDGSETIYENVAFLIAVDEDASPEAWVIVLKTDPFEYIRRPTEGISSITFTAD